MMERTIVHMRLGSHRRWQLQLRKAYWRTFERIRQAYNRFYGWDVEPAPKSEAYLKYAGGTR